MLWILLGCQRDPNKIDENQLQSETGLEIDTGIAEDSNTTDSPDSGNTDSGNTDSGNIDTDPVEPPKIVRFVALGDGGEGNQTQINVGLAIADICAQKTDEHDGCEFALYLGDNIYDVGVSSVLDDQFHDKFENPYLPLDFPFYVVLGNHDAGGWGSGIEMYKTEFQIDYTNYSSKWTMPDAYYDFTVEHVSFFGLDTNALMWDPWFGTGSDQEIWLPQALAGSLSDWKIAFGHHPYVSNGQHGNAGSYEGLDWITWPVADVPLGAAVKDFMDNHLCGKVDVYICGHDHNRQWLEPSCGTEFIVSGAAAKNTDLQNRGNPTKFEDDSASGFMWIEIQDNCLTGEFYDESGNLDFSHQICK